MKIIEFQKKINKICENKYIKYLIENGKTFDKNIIIDNIPEFVQQKNCFKNSLLYALTNDDIDYCEGWYMTDIGIPLDHAWNIDKNGNVIDLTSQKFNISVTERYGMKINKKYLSKYIETEQFLTTLQTFVFEKIKNNEI